MKIYAIICRQRDFNFTLHQKCTRYARIHAKYEIHYRIVCLGTISNNILLVTGQKQYQSVSDHS